MNEEKLSKVIDTLQRAADVMVQQEDILVKISDNQMGMADLIGKQNKLLLELALDVRAVRRELSDAKSRMGVN